MNWIINALKFTIYLVFSFGLLYVMHLLIYFGLFWIAKSTLSIFWIILILITGGYLAFGMGMHVIGFLSSIISRLNPFIKLSRYMIIPISIIYCLWSIIGMWRILDLDKTRELIIAICNTMVSPGFTLIYCFYLTTQTPYWSKNQIYTD